MQSDVERARGLVLRYGWNSTCFQILNPGIRLWFSAGDDAVVGYVRRHGVRVVAGAPVCAESRLSNVLAEFEGGRPVCYVGAEERLFNLLGDREGYATAILGAQPIWRPETFVERFDADRSLRQQRNRARNKGVHIVEWSAGQARGDPDLHRVLHEWLTTRGLPPMHFLVEPETLDDLDGRRLFVAERSGQPVAFVTLSPSPARGGWLTEQFVRGHDAPNGTIEFTLATAVEAVCDSGASFVTMGIVPLARRADGEGRGNPAWLRLLANWARAHGRRFYDFDGLEWFKQKFHPDDWQPVYAISNEASFSVRTLRAVVGAFSDGPPVLALARGLGRAVRTEVMRATSSSESPNRPSAPPR